MWRTLRKNWLKARLAWSHWLAVSELTLCIFTFNGSAVESNSRAYFNSQGFLWAKGSQQLSLWSQLVVKECKLSCVVLKVKVKNKSGLFSTVPSKLASILSLKRVWRRFSLLLNRAKYWQFWASFRQSAGEVGLEVISAGLSRVLDLSFK